MKKPLTVKQFNEYVKSNIKHDPIFRRIYISGELANVRINNHHLYFSLKEETDLIDCVIYYYEDKDISFDFETGKKILVKGNLSYNNYSSRLIIIANEVEDEGISKAYLEFLKLKEEFIKKGYFDHENKNPIDKLVKKIGLITSKDGAAIVDFISMINSRPNDIKIFLNPVKVQGEESSELIEKAIRRLDGLELDVIVITRGGGSNEDLSSFNQKEVIEAIHKAKTPIITAIGHNIDRTLSDLASDLSLQTPTEAGSYLISFYEDYHKKLDNLFRQKAKEIENILDNYALKLEYLRKRIAISNPKLILDSKFKDLSKLGLRIDKAIRDNLVYNDQKLKSLSFNLKAVEKIIEYSKKQIQIEYDDRLVFSKHSLKTDDLVKLIFSDGEVLARIIDG